MPVDINWTDVIIAGIVVLGGGGTLTLKKLGFTVARKNPSDANKKAEECPDPSCQSEVKQTSVLVKEIREDLREKIWPELGKLSRSTARIEGYMEGKR